MYKYTLQRQSITVLQNHILLSSIFYFLSTGGPGSGKGTQCKKITARYPDIVHLSMGDILRKEISDHGTADEKWAMITKLLKDGDMAPVVSLRGPHSLSSVHCFMFSKFPLGYFFFFFLQKNPKVLFWYLVMSNSDTPL